MEYESINLDPKLARESLNRLKGKRKIKEYILNAVVSKCQKNLAKFDLVEAMEEDMHEKMLRKIESEIQMIPGTFIYTTRGQREVEDEILLSLLAEVYVLNNM